MKKYFFLFLTLIAASLSAQQIAFDFAFVNAKDPGLYDDHLKTYFQPVNQQLIDDGRIVGWHVWKVIGAAQADYTHLVVSVYDIDKLDEDYDWKGWPERLSNLTEEHAREIPKMIGENREIVFEAQLVNVAE